MTRLLLRFSLAALLGLLILPAGAQAPARLNSADLHNGIQKLQFLGSALYVAAHPDDENTRMITYLDNVVDARTAYLSLTRGDGGQNLVGPQIRELLGLIRTQELLAARRIDGGEQFFTRANDFGYSKDPDETFGIWGREEVLADVVWAIRRFQPDIIINRFDHRTPGSTHGHHTASAMLSVEAFDMAGDPQAFPAQLDHINVWQPKRLFWNTSWWFYGSPERMAQVADSLDYVSVDVGRYLPKLGENVSEIAARSRSQHKSQGFGSSGSRGSEMEYLELLKGQMPTGTDDLFAGINTTWSRLEGGAPIGDLLARLERDFDFDNPAASVPALLQVREMISRLPDSYWKEVKLREAEELIPAAMGLFLEAVANDPSASPGRPVELTLEATNQSAIAARLQGYSVQPLGADSTFVLELPDNTARSLKTRLSLPADMGYSNPYWLNREWELGLYNVPDQLMRGLPETPAPLQVTFRLEIYDESNRRWVSLPVERPVIYKSTDRVKGEVYQPFEIVPPVFVNVDQTVYLFASDTPKPVNVKVTAGRGDLSGSVRLQTGEGWRTEPAGYDFAGLKKGEERLYTFMLYPPAGQSESTVRPVATVDGRTYERSMTRIDYDHIPVQTVFLDAATRIVRVDLQKEGERIGYLMGAGDDIPAALEQIGYQVELLDDADFTNGGLQRFDAIILGIRALNTVDRIGFYQPKLLEYVKEGGNLIVQYNTNRGLNLDMNEIGPYPLQLSRDRVTVEEAEVRILAPEHPALNRPNRITARDFEGWVQERGLYFPDEWSDEYTALLSSNDPGEPARNGGLLVADYGKGHFVYTGYSWFRQLPAGVPGAYRLFANLISL